jgi:hypothetical protein
MKMRSLILPALAAAFLLLLSAGVARADDGCRGYTRTVALPDGSTRLAAGTACQDDAGIWRVADEHLVSNYVEPTAAVSAPVIYDAGYYGPSPYYYPPYYYGPFYPVGFFSFGFHGYYGGHYYGGGHYGGGGFHGHR